MTVAGYSLNTIGAPLTRFPLRSTVTSTRLAILMNGMPLFIPNSLRSNAIVPLIDPSPIPLPVAVNVSFSGLVTPRMVKSPSNAGTLGNVPFRYSCACTSGNCEESCKSIMAWTRRSIWKKVATFLPGITLLKIAI